MKNIFKIFIVAVMITGMWSCESEDNFRIVEAPAAEFSFITPTPGSEVVITEGTEGTNTAVTFSWEAVDYGMPTTVTYAVEFALNGTEFAAPVQMSSASTTNYSITFAELNAAALEMGILPYDAETGEGGGAIDVRVKATVGTTGSEPKYSNELTILVKPFPSNVIRNFYLVGNATAAGWDNVANNPNFLPMFRDPEDIGLFTYVGYFAEGEVKLLEVRGQWAPMLGFSGGPSGELLARPTTDDNDPSALVVSTAGYYTLSINLNNMTYTFAAYGGDTTVVYPTVGILGSGTPGGWDNDQNMTNSAFDPHKWRTNIVIIDGMAKFRANDAWEINWGGNTPISGVGTQGGPDIPVTEGVYNVYFNDLDGRYIFIPVE